MPNKNKNIQYHHIGSLRAKGCPLQMLSTRAPKQLVPISVTNSTYLYATSTHSVYVARYCSSVLFLLPSPRSPPVPHPSSRTPVTAGWTPKGEKLSPLSVGSRFAASRAAGVPVPPPVTRSPWSAAACVGPEIFWPFGGAAATKTELFQGGEQRRDEVCTAREGLHLQRVYDR